MAVGGLAVSRRMVPTIARDLDALNRKNGVISEVKWSTAKRRRVSIHRLYADYLFNLVENGLAHFHIRFAPFNEYDHKKSGPAGRTDTVSKMYYQLLLHRPVYYYGSKAALFVYPDAGDCTAYLPRMRNQLCAGGYNSMKSKPNCVREIVPRNSRTEPLLQLLDVTLGALTAIRNERATGDVKAELASYILDKSPITDHRCHCEHRLGSAPVQRLERHTQVAKVTRPKALSVARGSGISPRASHLGQLESKPPSAV